MRDLHKNPVLYYVLAPVLLAAWPVLVWAVYLPAADEGRQSDEQALTEAQTAILEILKIDPDRLSIVDKNEGLGKFSYAEAIDRSANICNIPSSNYRFTQSGINTSQGKETQTARLTLENVGILQVASFLSSIQSMWVNLSCERMALKKKEGMPDQWDADMDFKYSY